MKKNSDRIFIISLWVIPLAFYLFFWAMDGAVWCADSYSYVDMHDCREPLYPTLLALLRWIFGINDKVSQESNISLTVMALLQSILAAVATAVTVSFFARQFFSGAFYSDRVFTRKVYTTGGKKYEKTVRIKQRLTVYLLLFIPMAVSLLNRFAAKRGSMYSNSIMTEGITISIYILAFRYILDYMLNGEKRAMLMASLMVFIGISTRKQMYVLFCLLIIAVFYRHKRIFVDLIMVLAAVGCALLFDCTYNLIVRGSFIIHTEDNRFVTTMALYTADREYVQYIEPELQGIFLDIYDACDANGWMMHDSPSDWNGAVDHFSDNYDHIQLDTMQVKLEKYVDVNPYSGFLPNMTKTEKIDAIRRSFNNSLLPHEADRLMIVFVNNLLYGLVNTVARRNMILCIYAGIIYTMLAVVFIRNMIKSGSIKKNAIKLTKDRSYDKYMCDQYHMRNVLTVLTLFSIIGNVTLVSAVIFCQTRYAVYNMPIFYMTLLTDICIFKDKRIVTDIV